MDIPGEWAQYAHLGSVVQASPQGSLAEALAMPRTIGTFLALIRSMLVAGLLP